MIKKLYVYDKETCLFSHEDTGEINDLLYDMRRNNQDFTLVKPPDYRNQYKWNGSEWIKAD